MENGQTHLEKTFLEGDILSISVYERNLFFLVELFHLFSRVRKFYEGIEGRCQAKYESLIVRDVKTHFSQKSHCNHNCNDFSDYDDIIAPLDKMIMLHFQLGLENSHFLRFEGLFSPGQSRSKTLG